MKGKHKKTERRPEQTVYVYLSSERSDGARKIGCTADPKVRKRHLASMNGFPIQFDACIKSPKGFWLERYLHRAFLHRRVRGEWFALTEEEVALILSISSASRESDLPAAIIALKRANARHAVRILVDYETFRRLRFVASCECKRVPEELQR